MPNPFKRTPGAICIDRGPYSMKMEDGENAEIRMYGEIVKSHPTNWYGEPVEGDFIAQDDFLRDLDSLGAAKTLTLRMDSIGGDALVAMVIHNRLRELSAKGTRLICIVDGAAMSAASDIMCACDEVKINPASLVMIHRCWSYLWGGYNADDLRELAAEHDAYDRAAVTIYQRKTKLPEADLLRMMSETTYLTGAEAVEKGFADQLLEDAQPLNIAASADGRSLFVRGRQIHLTPGMFAPDNIPTVTPETPVSADATKQEGGSTMEEKIVEQQPRMDGQPDPVLAERKRIQEIDALAGLYDAETVQAAKYGENACTAQEMAYRAAQKAAQQGRQHLSGMMEDYQTSGAQEVPAAGDPGTPPPKSEQTPEQRMAYARAEVKALFGKEEK